MEGGEGGMSDPSEREQSEWRGEEEAVPCGHAAKTKESPSRFLRSRQIAYLVACLVAIGTGFGTYLALKATEQVEFRASFESYAREVANIAENNAENTFGQLRALAMMATSMAEIQQDGFPNVLLPNFAGTTQEIATRTGAEMLLFVPFVGATDEEGYEAFVANNRDKLMNDYYNSSFAVQPSPVANEEVWSIRPVPEAFTSVDTREGFNDVDEIIGEVFVARGLPGEGGSFPIVQYGPGTVDTALTLVDLISNQIFQKEFVASLEYDVPVISEAMDLQFLLDHVKAGERAREDQRLRSFTLDEVKENFQVSSRTLGYIVGIVPWDTFFQNQWPDEVSGLVVTVASDCGSTLTFVLGQDSGTAASAAGNYHNTTGGYIWQTEGDWHDRKYDDWGITYRFFWKDHPEGQSRHCHFDLIVYPSDEFRETFMSNVPLIYAGITVGAWFMAIGIFFFFDMYTRKRQRQIMAESDRAKAVVTSLFPEHVGQKLMEEAEQERRAKENQRRLSNFLNSGNDCSSAKNIPIADHYVETTVMFADIAGFTAWSSTREPAQVFKLLESLYGSFDEIAERRHVFKVETIGDCYVAVAGCPEPMKNHAIAIVRFASDCLTSTAALLGSLQPELGPGTSDLGLRVGIHSGPVTAGVLRGKRARFQLFGDTMNTTARIESSGEKNRIHVSSQTAEILFSHGKGHWVMQRKDKVLAKGKGELQTYWVSVATSSSNSHTDTTSQSATNEHDGREKDELIDGLKRRGFLDGERLEL